MSSFRVASASAAIISTLLSLAAGQAPMGGKASRYWDCCKPACSWQSDASGNPLPVSSPVKTCGLDGNAISDHLATSACQGGSAYACTGLQPWAVNDQLAYGFAAVSVAGETTADSCCGCYELTFTDGPAQGQKMIVQATNTGADLGTNQFDLLIPGGGPGLYDACPAQYGVSSSAFGQQYGGILDQSGCSGLPAALQAGCGFRFGWFKGADNPGVSFQKLDSCPSALTDLSGCVRNGQTPSSGVQAPAAAAAGAGGSSQSTTAAASPAGAGAGAGAAASSSTVVPLAAGSGAGSSSSSSEVPAVAVATPSSGSSGLFNKPAGKAAEFAAIPPASSSSPPAMAVPASSSMVKVVSPPAKAKAALPTPPPAAEPAPAVATSKGDGGLPFWAIGPSWGTWKAPNVPGYGRRDVSTSETTTTPAVEVPTPTASGAVIEVRDAKADGSLPFWAVGPTWGTWKAPDVPGVEPTGPAAAVATPQATEGPDDECDEM